MIVSDYAMNLLRDAIDRGCVMCGKQVSRTEAEGKIIVPDHAKQRLAMFCSSECVQLANSIGGQG